MKRGVLSKVAGLGALTAAGQLLVVGTLPLYSRTFDPAAYGEYIVFVGAYAIVSVFAGLRYDSAIVLPRSQGMAQALSLLVVALGLLVAALIALATPGLVIASSASPATKGAELNLGYGLAVATVLGALQRCLTSWCIRRSRFLSMGWAQFLFSLITVIAQLSLVRLIPQLPALVWGYVGALLGQLLWLAAAVPGAFTRSRPSWRALRVVARKYRRFPRYMVGYALASSVRDRLIQLAFGLGAGAAVLGRFGLAYRVMFAPNSLIYSAVSPVFYSLASRGRPEAVGRFAADLVEASFVALVTPYVALAIEAPALTEVTLSAKWHGTGPFFQRLRLPLLFFRSPSGSIARSTRSDVKRSPLCSRPPSRRYRLRWSRCCRSASIPSRSSGPSARSRSSTIGFMHSASLFPAVSASRTCVARWLRVCFRSRLRWYSPCWCTELRTRRFACCPISG